MITEKLENIALRAKRLLGNVSPMTWRVLRDVPGSLAVAAEVATALEAGEDDSVDLSLTEIIRANIADLRALGGVADQSSYEAIHPIIRDLEDLLPLAETLEGGMQLVFRDEPREPKPAA